MKISIFKLMKLYFWIKKEGSKIEMKRTLIRLGRVAVAAAVGGVMTELQGDTTMVALIPVISALGKLLRDKTGWTWLPF